MTTDLAAGRDVDEVNMRSARATCELVAGRVRALDLDDRLEVVGGQIEENQSVALSGGLSAKAPAASG